MEPIKIAIVDSGISKKSYLYRNNVKKGIFINRNLEYLVGNIEDEHGHGTHCAELIYSINSNVDFYIVKILDGNVKSTNEQLVRALKYLLEINVKIINLSLSMIQESRKQELYDVCQQLKNQGKIIVASLKNNYDKSYPGIFNNVIGVKGENKEKKYLYCYNAHNPIQCICDGTPIIFKGINQRYSLFTGNSKATALFTGILSSMEINCSFEELNIRLEQEQANYIRQKKNLKHYDVPIKFKEKCLRMLAEITKKEIKKEYFEMANALFYMGLNTGNYCEFLKKCEENWGTMLKCPIKYIDIFSIESLYILSQGGNL